MKVEIDNITGKERSNKFKEINLNQTFESTKEKASISWNQDEETFDFGLAGGVVAQGFREMFFYGKNATGQIVPDGTPVMFAAPVGASGKVEFQLAVADGTIPSAYIMGITTQTIGIGEFGNITTFGNVRGIQTNGANYGETWSDGDLIYVGSTPGTLTNIEPNVPNQNILVAAVIVAHATLGTLLVRPTWNPKLTELDDVNGTPFNTMGQVLYWNQTNGYFDATSNIFLDDTLSRIGVGTNSPTASIDIVSNGKIFTNNPTLRVSDSSLRGSIVLESVADQQTDFVFKNNNRLSWNITSRPSTGNYNLNFYASSDGLNFNKTVLALANSGNVGIGEVIPNTPLHISSIPSTTTNFVTLFGDRNSVDTEVGILFRDRTAIDSEGDIAGRIYTERQGSAATFDLVFDAETTEGLRIAGDNGNVGIGTVQPLEKLHIAGTFGTGIRLERISTPSVWDIGAGENTAGDFRIKDVTANLTRVQIDSSGFVGVGLTAPQRKLHLYDATINNLLTIESGDSIAGMSLKDSDTTNYDTVVVQAQGDDMNLKAGAIDVLKLKGDTGYAGVNKSTPSTQLHVGGALTLSEVSTDPSDPTEGDVAIWKSDGTGTGDDGDILYKEKSAGVTTQGSLKWKQFEPTSYTLNTGTLVSGDVTSVQTMFDGNDLLIQEVAAPTGWDVEFNFTGVDRCPTFIVTRWRYDGSNIHYCTWDIYNYVTASWDQVRMFTDSALYYASMTQMIPLNICEDYVDGSGNMKIRAYHHTAGNVAHDVHFDYVGLAHSLQNLF